MKHTKTPNGSLNHLNQNISNSLQGVSTSLSHRFGDTLDGQGSVAAPPALPSGHGSLKVLVPFAIGRGGGILGFSPIREAPQFPFRKGDPEDSGPEPTHEGPNWVRTKKVIYPRAPTISSGSVVRPPWHPPLSYLLRRWARNPRDRDCATAPQPKTPQNSSPSPALLVGSATSSLRR